MIPPSPASLGPKAQPAMLLHKLSEKREHGTSTQMRARMRMKESSSKRGEQGER